MYINITMPHLKFYCANLRLVSQNLHSIVKTKKGYQEFQKTNARKC